MSNAIAMLTPGLCAALPPLATAAVATSVSIVDTTSRGAGGFKTVFRGTRRGDFPVVDNLTNQGDGARPAGTMVREGIRVVHGGTTIGPVFEVEP